MSVFTALNNTKKQRKLYTIWEFFLLVNLQGLNLKSGGLHFLQVFLPLYHLQFWDGLPIFAK